MNDKINTIEDLKEVASRSINVITKSEHRKRRGTVQITMNSYSELSHYLIDVIKVSVAALDAEAESVTEVRNVASAVSGVLQTLIGIVPLEEMELLDKVRDLL
ncbi:hypothetical protein [Pedobacter sp. ASV28]|uniref:hypothetical protein n=1 Tax=Pedobacter sp. ASV28 TaxID=2795123 RepID=UPI0018EC481C|nr:hypothetical protein [Pedobacter sp. ASV28]